MTCIFPLCVRPAYHDELCIGHQMFATTVKVKERKRISKRSKKKIKENKELAKLYPIYLAKDENKVCNIQIDEGCTYFATVVNHTRRRGANVMNQSDWEPSCVYCNGRIEEEHEWAKNEGHLKSKFNNE